MIQNYDPGDHRRAQRSDRAGGHLRQVYQQVCNQTTADAGMTRDMIVASLAAGSSTVPRRSLSHSAERSP